MSSFVEAANALRRAAVKLDKAPAAAVTVATAQLSSMVLAGQQPFAPSGRLRGVGKGGAPIGVSGTVRGLTGVVRAVGPAHLLDHDTKPHGGHPGTRGKRYFEDSVDTFEPGMVALFAVEVADAVEGL